MMLSLCRPRHARVLELLRCAHAAGGRLVATTDSVAEEWLGRGLLDDVEHFEEYRGDRRASSQFRRLVELAVVEAVDRGFLIPFGGAHVLTESGLAELCRVYSLPGHVGRAAPDPGSPTAIGPPSRPCGPSAHAIRHHAPSVRSSNRCEPGRK